MPPFCSVVNGLSSGRRDSSKSETVKGVISRSRGVCVLVDESVEAPAADYFAVTESRF
jgi:hypothetical protein